MSLKHNLEGKKLLITGGTGSFGSSILKSLEYSGLDEIRVFSRDEKKQDDLRKKYIGRNVTFHLGDVREFNSVNLAMRGIDYVFHAAAYKQVPSCEFFPIEAMKTNVIGSENVANACIESGVRKAIFLSTDKAVYPINAMGITKALMEKVILSKSRFDCSTDFCVTRYGNVMASRGSVIPLLIDQIKNGLPLTLTNPNMTRFLMSLDDAIDLVEFAFSNGNNGDLLIQKSPACTIETLATALQNMFGVDQEHKQKVIGTRHGEKLYEVLLSCEEMAKAEDLKKYFRVAIDTRSLEYEKYSQIGEPISHNFTEYNSHNTERLNVEQTRHLLSTVSEVKRLLI